MAESTLCVVTLVEHLKKEALFEHCGLKWFKQMLIKSLPLKTLKPGIQIPQKKVSEVLADYVVSMRPTEAKVFS